MTTENTGLADAERTREYVSGGGGGSIGGQAYEGQSPRTFGNVREDTSYISHTNPITGATIFDRRFWGSGKHDPQLIFKIRMFEPRGYRLIGTTTVKLPAEFTRVDDILDEYYERARFEAEYVRGYRHTPASITASALLPVLVGWYVPNVANVRTALSLVSMFEYNDAFRSLRKNFVTASKVRRLISLHEQFESIPMVNHWRMQAVNMAGVFTDREGGVPIITLYDTPVDTVTGETPTNFATDVDALSGTGDVAASIWTDLIANAEKAIKVLRGLATTTTFNPDTRALMDLWRMLQVPRGLPERPRAGIHVDEFMVKNRMKYSALAAKNTKSAADALVVWPAITSEEDVIVRPWEGTPNEYWWAGMTDMYAWLQATDLTRTTKAGYQLGQLLPNWSQDEKIDGTAWYNIEDGWKSFDFAEDFTDVEKIDNVFRAPGLRNHVWSAEIVHSGGNSATMLGSSEPSAYGTDYSGKGEHDLRDIADSFYKKMVAVLEYAVA